MFVCSGDFFSSSWFLQEKMKSYKQNFKFEEGGRTQIIMQVGLTQTIETVPVTVLLIYRVKAVCVPYSAFMRAGEVKFTLSCYHRSGEHGWVKSTSFTTGLRKATNNN